MTFLCCLKNRKQVLRFVNYMNKRQENITFSFGTEKDHSFSFLDVKICREKDKFTKSVFRIDTLILVVFQSLNANLAYCIHFYIEVSQLCLIFPNFNFNLKHLRKHFIKILIPQNLLTNEQQNVLIIYLFKNLFSPPFQNWNLNSVTIFRKYFQHHQKETEQMYQ